MIIGRPTVMSQRCRHFILVMCTLSVGMSFDSSALTRTFHHSRSNVALTSSAHEQRSTIVGSTRVVCDDSPARERKTCFKMMSTPNDEDSGHPGYINVNHSLLGQQRRSDDDQDMAGRNAGEKYPVHGTPSTAWGSQRLPDDDDFAEGIPRLNTLFLTGYLGQDPKPKYFESGKVVLNLSLAVKREYHPLERKAFGIVYGEEETDWFQLEMWNRDAEYAAKICSKGGRVGVQGSLKIEEWTDRDGNLRKTKKVLVQNLELLDSRAEKASRRDRSEENLWESERQEKAAAAQERRSAVAGAAAGYKQAAGGGGESGGGSGAKSTAQQAQAKEAEDKWWSSAPATPTQKDASWWDEDPGGGGPRTRGRGGAGGAEGLDSDALPSFFDD